VISIGFADKAAAADAEVPGAWVPPLVLDLADFASLGVGVDGRESVTDTLALLVESPAIEVLFFPEYDVDIRPAFSAFFVDRT
jgi:hypothetical protein